MKPWTLGDRDEVPNGVAALERRPAARGKQPAARPAGAGRHVARAAEAAAPGASGERMEYQAEVSRLLDLIVNSLYSNKEVFLRELVSNASDALDKIRFQSVTDESVLGDVRDLAVWISGDTEQGTVTIEDTGIGMTREELVQNLGSIASSGTAKFLEAAQSDEAQENLIGRFGVGFYSAFLVAETVVVDSKHNDEEKAYRWQSTISEGSYTVGESPEQLARGTKITLYLKEDSKDYANPETICNLVKTYSEFIDFPIRVYASSSEPKQVKDEEATQKAVEQYEERKKAAEEKGEEFSEEPPSDVMKTEYEEVWDWRVQNNVQPLWTRSPRNVEESEYKEFFKNTFKEFLDPLTWAHFSAEGEIEFRALLFIPGMAPFDQQEQMQGKSRNVRLYVRRVFISDQFDEDLLPRYLNFVKGIIDSSDLPLNVSREILQESRVVRVMKRRLVRRALDMIEELANKDDDGEAYSQFWNSFGRYIKLGIIEDSDNRNTLSRLLRFYSSKSEEKLTSLDEYVSRMPEGSNTIYYMAADSFEAARSAPFLEGLVQRGHEVLYLTEPIDEVAITNLGSYGDYKIVDVSKEQADPGQGDEEERKKQEERSKELGHLTQWLKDTLGSSKVEDVRVSSRLSETPCVLSTSQHGWSANMERIMRAQAMGDAKAMEFMRGKKILEVNPDHAVIRDLSERVQANPSDADASLRAEVLYETALLTSGFQIDNPSSFASRVFDLMSSSSTAPSPASSSPSPSSQPEAAREPDRVDQADSDGGDPWKS